MTTLPMGIADLATMAVLLILLVSAVTWLAFNGLSRGSAGLPGDIFITVDVLAASLLTLVAAIRRHRYGLTVRPWVALTIACHLWLIGEVVWLIARHYLTAPVGVPSWADSFLLLFAPAVAWSFVPAFPRQRRQLGWLIGLLDVAIVVVTFAVALATPLIADGLSGSPLGFGARLVVMLWVLSGILVMLPALALVAPPPGGDRLWFWPLMGGLLLIGAGNIVYAAGLRDAVPNVSAMVCLGWTTGFVAIAVAAVLGGWQSRAVAAGDHSGGSDSLSGVRLTGPTMRTGMAMVTASLLGVVALFVILRSPSSSQGTVVAAVVLVALVVGRLLLTAVETDRLLRAAARATGDRRLMAEVFARSPATDSRARLEHVQAGNGLASASWLVDALAWADRDTAAHRVLSQDAALFAVIEQALAGKLSDIAALADAAARAGGAVSGRIERGEYASRLSLAPDEIGAMDRDRAIRRMTIGGGTDTEVPRSAVIAPVSHGIAPPVTLTLEWAGDGGETVDAALIERIANAVEVALLVRREPVRQSGEPAASRQAWIAPLLAARAEASAFAALIDAALESAGAGQVAVLCWSPLADELEVAATRTVGIGAGLFLAGERAPLDIWPTIRRVMEERATVTTADDGTSLTLPERERVGASGIRSALIVPLLVDDRCVGAAALLLAANASGAEAAFGRFRELVALTGLVVERARLADDLRAAADRDDATRLLTARAFREHIAERLESARGAGFVLIELDGAAVLEHRYGFGTAERGLSAIAGLLAGLDEPPLIAGRVGLAGIGVLLREAADTEAVIQRLRGDADALSVTTATGRIHLDVQMRGAGVPSGAESLSDVLAALDRQQPDLVAGRDQSSSRSL